MAVGAAFGQARQAGEEGGEFVVVPQGYSIHATEQYQAAPDRVRARPGFVDIPGFAGYLEEFKSPQTKLFVSLQDDGLEAVAVLDYHTAKEPKWCDWQATLKIPTSKEWRLWSSTAGKWLDQVAMSEFIQDNVPDIVQPPGAEMLELCGTIKASVGVQFESGYNIQNGAVQLNYTETVGARAGAKGALQIPEGFRISIPVLRHGANAAIQLRFRYRVIDKKLSLRFDIPQSYKILEVMLEETVAELQAKTGLQAFLGKP